MSLISLNQLNMVLDGIKQKLKNHRGNWEQNDKNADDYIKNRPFYTGTATVSIVENEVITISSDGGYEPLKFNIDKFVDGQTYIVTLNDEEYQCVAWNHGNIYGIGNGSLAGYTGKGENVPFACGWASGNLYLFVSTAGTYNISISCIQEVVHQIDKKYVPIPDGIVTEDDIHNIVDDEMNGLSSVAFTGDYNDLYNQPNVVKFDSQYLTDTQKAIARDNIGAGTSNFSGNYADLTGIPEQVQSDWNESDSTKPSYIIGRTHYEEPFEVQIIDSSLNGVAASGDNIDRYAWRTLDIEDSQITKDTIIKFVESPSVSSVVNYSMSGKVSYYTCEDKYNLNYCYEYYIAGNKSLLNGLTTPAFGMDFGTNEDTGEKYVVVIEKYKLASSGTMVSDYPRIYVLSNVHWNILRFRISVINNNVVQLDEKYIPDTIARASDVDELSVLIGDTSVADQIASAIDNLQIEGDSTTGAVRYDETQSLTPEQMAMARENIGAVSADDVFDTKVVHAYTWDGSTDGRDSFVYDSFPYYKVSDDVPEFSPDYIVNSVDNDGLELSLLYQGTKCYRAGWAIIVTNTGTGGLPLEGSDYDDGTYDDAELYTALSTGVYFFSNDITGDYQTSLTLSLKGIFADVSIDATLSKEGEAADAKAVGDAIGELETSVSNKVPTIRTINGKTLTSDIALTPEDIGAADATETSEAIAGLNELIGDKPVAEQIAEAIVEVYVQDEAPVDAPEGSIWVDLDEDGAPSTSGKAMANVYVENAMTSDATTIDFSKYAIGDVVVITTS